MTDKKAIETNNASLSQLKKSVEAAEKELLSEVHQLFGEKHTTYESREQFFR